MMRKEYTVRVFRTHKAIRCVQWVVLPFACMLAAMAQTSARTPIADVSALLEQGKSLASAGRLAEAELPLNSAVVLAPSNVQVLTLLAEVKSRMGDAREAAKLFRRVVALQPNSDTVHLNLAIALADMDDAKSALSQVDVAIRLNPRNVRAHLNRARLLADAKRNLESRLEFEKTAALAPVDPEILYYWGVMEKDDHKPQAAASLFAKLVVLQPDNSRAYFMLGQCLDSLHRQAEAIAAWRRAIELDPNSLEITYALAQSLRSRNPSEADEMLEKFRSLQHRKENTEQARTLGNQAYAAMQKQLWQEAVGALQQAIEICHDCALTADLHQRLGLAECHAGNLDMGERELRIALAIKPDDRQTVEALQWIADQRKLSDPR